MREQIRLWFYSQFFMSVTLVGRSPYRRVLTYEKLLDETGREMHRSWGNAIDANEAFDRMGADVMRWLFCEHVAEPEPQASATGRRGEVKRRLLTLWNSVSFFVTYANIEDFEPTYADLEPAVRAQPLDRWLVARTRQLVARGDRRRTTRYWTPARHARVRARSSTISPTGTSAARAAASGTATRPRSGRSGTRSSRRCA